jgi:hypothetical protein
MSYHFEPINILDTSNSTGLGSGGSMNIGGGISIGRDTFIGGNLSISGTATSFSDNILLINQNPQSSSDTGILFERHTSDIQNEHNYVSLIYKESDDEFVFGYMQNNVHKEVTSFSGYTGLKANYLNLTSTENSSFTNGGALIVSGGVSISKDTYINGKLTLNDTLTFNTTGNNKSSIEFDSTQYLFIGNNKSHLQINGNDTENNPGHIELAYNTYLSIIHKLNNGNTEIEIARLSSSGNIGIGTTAPSHHLDVSGNINFTGDLLKNGEVLSENPWSVNNQQLFYTKGNVGIGTTSPTTTLDVSGNISVTGNSNTIGSVIFTTNGNVGIGTTAPSSLLHVDGQIYCNTIVTTSDERLKKDISLANSESCYNTLKQLPLKTFRWNNDILNLPMRSNEFRVGWLAQDVEDYIPNSVETMNAYGISDCKSINLDQIVAVMYGTIQELQKKVEELERSQLQFIDR